MAGKTFVMKWTKKSEFILPHDDGITKIIVSMPPQSVTSITDLDLNYNPVTNVKNAWKLKNVQEVNLENCDLDFIPNWLASLPSLQTIWLGNNNIGELPNWLNTLQHLERIEVFENPLEMISAVHNLSKIDVGKCNIQSLPYDFFRHQLESVNIDDNKGLCYGLLIV